MYNHLTTQKLRNNFRNLMKPNEMFLNDLYTIKRILQEGNSNKLSILIQLNPSHEIFKGHFPGNPILPGVCIVQILKEILIYHMGKKLILNSASSIKYLSYINPRVNRIINFEVELKEIGIDNIFCNASLYFESIVFCRFKGDFKIIQR
jgi:3-hydroxyacyl-[acyl-carrier-protein] dehydratase